jgi:arylsulfatase A-like enzyme
MAAEGMRFTDHYAGSTVCAPSRCSLMTGLHTGHARIRGNADVPLEPADATVAEALRDRGYATALIGKWGLGEWGTTGHPNRKGFDTFFGYLNQVHAHNYYPDFLWRNGEKVPLDNAVVFTDSGYAKGIGGAAIKRRQYSHDLFTEEAFRFIRAHEKNPFFLYLVYTIPHANNESGIVHRHGMEVPDLGEFGGRDWPEPQKAHAAMICRLDRDIDRLLSLLKETGLDRDTVVFFSSDNGPHREGGADPGFFRSAGSFRGIKRDLYEGGIRVPLIVRWPGRVPAGRVSAHVSAFWDFMPTACEIAAVPVPPGLDGISFFPELQGTTQDRHEYLYWEFHENQFSDQAIRVGNWKAVRHGLARPVELYDLSSDPGEIEDIAADRPEVCDRLEPIFSSAHLPNPVWTLR